MITIRASINKMPFRYIIGLLVGLLAGLFCLSFLIGRYPISPIDVLRIIVSDIFMLKHNFTDIMYSVVMDIRIPRIILAICVGAGLSVSGASFQGVFRNPLVSQDVMGVSAAAGFGAILAMSLDFNYTFIRLISFCMGLIGVAFAYGLSRIHKTSPIIMMVLSGIVVSSLFNAGLSILKYMADPMEELPQITFWLMGSLSSAHWGQVAFVLPMVIFGVAILLLISWRINLLSLGDEEARSLGVRTEMLKVIIILAATLITATCVSVCGTIGWIGLVMPHMARSLSGPDHRRLIPAAALIGASFLLVIDDISRVLTEAVLPLGILTSLIGAPFFGLLIRKTKNELSKG